MHSFFIHMKPFQKNTDGRSAYKALFDYHLGKKYLQNHSWGATEAIFNKLRYTGESKQSTFDQYVKNFLFVFLVMESLFCDLEGIVL